MIKYFEHNKNKTHALNYSDKYLLNLEFINLSMIICKKLKCTLKFIYTHLRLKKQEL